jgi:hypothetical protein
MADKITKTYQVLGGPSREELFDALRLFNERRQSTFEICFIAQPWECDEPMIMRHHNTRQTVCVYVTGIIACRGLIPNAEPIEGKLWIVNADLCMHQDEEVPVRIIFDTKLRTGTMTYYPESPMTPGEYDGIIHPENPPENQGPSEDPPEEPTNRT